MDSFTLKRYGQASKPLGRSFLVLLSGLLTAGCGDSHGEVSGKVFYKGQPLTAPGTVVKFMDANGGVTSTMVAPDGGYAIPKLPVGQVKIAVVVLPLRRIDLIEQKAQEAIKSGKMNLPPEEREKLSQSHPARGLPIALPPYYADPDKSGLMHTVTGGKQTHDIELK